MDKKKAILWCEPVCLPVWAEELEWLRQIGFQQLREKPQEMAGSAQAS